MRIYMINDTRGFHAGATAATEGIIKTLEAQGHEIVGTCPVGEDPHTNTKFTDCLYDAVVCNGEGTLHHGRGQPLLNFMQSAADRGKKVFLVNATWDSMTTFDAKKLMKAKNVFFRDVTSFDDFQEDAKKGGLEPDTNRQFSGYCFDTSTHPCVSSGIEILAKQLKDCTDKVVIGQFYGFQGFPGNYFTPLPQLQASRDLALYPFETLHLKEGTWPELIATLRGARIYITGQYHGVLLALLAGVPFVSMMGTSHKMAALWETLVNLGDAKMERDGKGKERVTNIFLDHLYYPFVTEPVFLGSAARKCMDGHVRAIYDSVVQSCFKARSLWPGLVKKMKSNGKAVLY